MSVMAKDKENARHYAFAAFVKDAASQEELQRIFRSDTLADTYVGPGDIAAAIAWLQRHGRSPQRLLVDISGSSRPLDDLERLADACEPSVEVYVVGDRNDVGLYRNLLLRGIRDYLVKPLSVELLRRTLSASGAGVRRGRHGKCVTIMGTRGGVGVTSVAAHLARTLVRGGARRRVVYMDLNVHDGSGASILGRQGGNALLDVLGNIDRLDQQYLERTLTEVGQGLYSLTAELDYAEEFWPPPQAFGVLLDTLCQHFHYVVLDVPQRGGTLASEVLSHAEWVCLVADLSVHSARTLARLVRHIEGRPNPPSLITVLNHIQPVSRHQVDPGDFQQATEIPVQVRIGHDPKGPILAENLACELEPGTEFARGVQTISSLVTGESATRAEHGWWQRLIGMST